MSSNDGDIDTERTTQLTFNIGNIALATIHGSKYRHAVAAHINVWHVIVCNTIRARCYAIGLQSDAIALTRTNRSLIRLKQGKYRDCDGYNRNYRRKPFSESDSSNGQLRFRSFAAESPLRFFYSVANGESPLEKSHFRKEISVQSSFRASP
jgi:hypothetical protein